MGVYIPTKLMLDVRREYASGEPTDSAETKEVMWVSAARAPELVNTQPCRMRLENMANHVAGVAQVSYETHPLSVRFRRAFGPTYAPRAAVRYR